MSILIVGHDIGSKSLFRALAGLISGADLQQVLIIDEPRQPQPCDMEVVLREFSQNIKAFDLPLPPLDPMPIVIELRATPANPLLTRPASHRLGRREMKRRRTQANPDYG